MTFHYTPAQLRYIADVAEAANRIPSPGVHTDEAYVDSTITVRIPEHHLADIVFDHDDDIWLINLLADKFDARTWVRDHVEEFSNPVRKIQMIKELRAASPELMGLKECKDLVEEFLPPWTAVRPGPSPRPDVPERRLFDDPPPYPPLHDDCDACGTSYPDEPDNSENEDRAYAEMLERRAETGTWFGASTWADEEPPF